MTKQVITVAMGACLLMVGAARADHSYPVEDNSSVQHSFAGDKSLDVDNVNGFIHVVGDSGGAIRVEGERIIRARDRQALESARKQVTLDINEKDGVAQIYVNGPFRDHNRDGDHHGFHEHGDRGYEVIYNLTVHVPKQTDLRLYTVNDGDITVQSVSGKFDVHNINGGVQMTDVGGWGSASALNGPTKVSFRESPSGNSYFHSFNGRLDVILPANLSAELRFKTFNGHVYTDFDVTSSPVAAVAAERKNGKYVYKSNQFTGARVGSGGPELKFETFNGDIHIQKQGS